MLQVPISPASDYFQARKNQSRTTKSFRTIFDVLPASEVVTMVKKITLNCKDRWKRTRCADPDDLVQTCLMYLLVRPYNDKVTPGVFINVQVRTQLLKIHNALGQQANHLNYQALRGAGVVDDNGPMNFEVFCDTYVQAGIDYIDHEDRDKHPKPQRIIKVLRDGCLVGEYLTTRAVAEAIGVNQSSVQNYLNGWSKNSDGYQFEVSYKPKVGARAKKEQQRRVKPKFLIYHPSGKLLGKSDSAYLVADDLGLHRQSIYDSLRRGKSVCGGYRFVWEHPA